MERKQTGKILLIAALLLLSFSYFVFLAHNIKKSSPAVKNHRVYFAYDKMYVFDDVYPLVNSSNKVSAHGDYFLIQEPLKTKTTVYSLNKEQVVQTFPYMVLDFDGKNVLYYKNGRETYFNKGTLGISCQSGYIQDSHHVLCVVPKQNDNLDNKIIQIDTITKEQKDLYVPSNTISALTVYKNNLYVGEYNLQTRKNFITVDKQTTPSATLINIFFTGNKNLYCASFPNTFNNMTASYSKVVVANNEIIIPPVGERKIIFWDKNNR